jgi:hypothetical protein
MAKWFISFVVDKKHVGDILEVLQPYKVEDLNFKIVAGTATKIRAGDKPAWELAAGLGAKQLMPLGHFKDKLRAAGVKDGSIYNSLNRAVEQGALRMVKVKGVKHYATKGS